MLRARIRVLRWLVLCAAFAIAEPVHADFVNVLVIDPVIDEMGGENGFSPTGRYADAYADMIDSTKFGSGGVVDRSFNFLPAVGSLGMTSLANVGLVLLAHKDDTSPSPGVGGEVATLTEYVSSGGSLLSLGHSMSYNWDNALVSDRSLSDELASRDPAAFVGPLPPFRSSNELLTPTSASGPIIEGPFGTVSLAESTENAYWMGSNSGSTGTFALQYLATDGNNYVDGLYGTFGDGRYMMLGSTDLVSTSYGNFDNQEFFLNSVAWVTAVPEPSSLWLLATVGFAGVLLEWRRRRTLASAS